VTGFTTSTNFPTINSFPLLTNIVVTDVVTKSNHIQFTNAVISTNITTFTNLNRQTNGTILGDAFISKFNSDLSQLLFSVYLGGSNDDAGLQITTDSAGSALVTGYTFSSDFPTNMLTTPQSDASNFVSHVFVAKVDTNNSLVYLTAFGGSRYDQGTGISVDSLGNAFVTGSTSSTNFFAINSFTSIGEMNLSAKKATNNIFITVLSPDGSTFNTNKNVIFGGFGNDEANDIVVNAAGDAAYIVGQTTSTNFPMLNPAQSILGNGKKPAKISDAFTSKILLPDPVE
jgi:hypothetical protein